MKYPSIRVVYNRSGTANKERATSVYVEVVYKQKKRYIPTGVKVKLGEFDQKKSIVVRRNDLMILNQMISNVFGQIQRYIFDLQQEGKEFTFEEFDSEIKGSGNKDSFIDYLQKAIKERSDIEPTTKKQQLVVVKKLIAFGKIKTFSSLTDSNIRAFDKWLHDTDMKGMSQVSIHNVHKRLKPYVREAKRLRLIKEDPYDFVKIERVKNKMI
ncbi:MAG: phage integrase SAM-like domain-containing protein, partial [Bacteroidales bacterium]